MLALDTYRALLLLSTAILNLTEAILFHKARMQEQPGTPMFQAVVA